MNVSEIREKLISLADPEYGDFVAKGAPSELPVLGVRTPKIEELAKEIFKDSAADEILRELKPKSREEIHLLSFLLALKIKRDGLNKVEFLNHVSRFDSWEMVDLFCARLKVVKKNREEWLELIDEMLEKSEFFARMGLVLLLDYYVDADYIQIVFDRVLRVKNREEYYVKMATAWTIQKCFVYFPDMTFVFMKTVELPEWTLRKAASKIRDSYRVDTEWKEEIKTLF